MQVTVDTMIMTLYSRKTGTSLFVLVVLQLFQTSTAEHNFTDCCKSSAAMNSFPCTLAHITNLLHELCLLHEIVQYYVICTH